MTILVTRPHRPVKPWQRLRSRGQDVLSAPSSSIFPGTLELPLLVAKTGPTIRRCPSAVKDAVYHANERLIQQNYLWSDKLCCMGLVSQPLTLL